MKKALWAWVEAAISGRQDRARFADYNGKLGGLNSIAWNDRRCNRLYAQPGDEKPVCLKKDGHRTRGPQTLRFCGSTN